ncbi:vacuolar protein sorting-associated protein 41 homolog [Condylostylus longicornis]|uniref:vacuolar protein sorting-associated protein 41 homolog n=1 Tax=Condylostylus longicornis TaxID=2530218 RepID=UPI00244E220E|nr:vacuolar protein sorting-associated protein 41 homolog [Condylostylus longicornis]
MSDETDSDLSEDVEPIFKYIRIGNDLTDIVNNDIVTCVAVHEKFLVFGTYCGRIHILDHQGYLAKPLAEKLVKISHFHSVAVNQISIDKKGEFLASCSDDGKIFLTGLFGDDGDQKLLLGKSVKCIALDSETKYSSVNRFIIGDENLILYEKNFLNNMKPVVLCKADGYVSAVSWNTQFIAWTSNTEVRVYDLNEKCSLGVMKWEEPKYYSLKNFRCNLRWTDSCTLLIGWGDTVRICIIRKRNSIDASTRLYPGHIVDPISTFQTPFFISGLASLDMDRLVLLGYEKKRNEDNDEALRPILCVVTYTSNDYERITTDSLSLRGYQKYKVNDYFLEYIKEEKRYYIVAPKDIVVAILHDVDDKIQWLIEHKKFDTALELVSTNNTIKFSYLSVARGYIDHLLSLKQYSAAAKLCSTALGDNKSLWEEEVYKFVKHQELRSISPYLPCSATTKLDPYVYEMVLFEYLKLDAKGFLNLVKKWPPDLYNAAAVINAVKDNFSKEKGNELLEALAILYAHEENYNCALKLYLTIKNKEVFNLIKTCGLYSSIYPMIIPLIELDSKMAMDILLHKEVSSDIVVEHLEQRQDLLFEYLKGYDKEIKNGKYHWKLVNLYAKFDNKLLLSFLKRSNNYPIQEALDICKRESFYEEMVYLLERMGNTSEALNIIVQKLKDIDKAIEFCKRLGDSDLWSDLIKESLKNNELIPLLLNNMVGYIEPEILVEQIKPGENIPGLKNSLIKMLHDYSLQESIQEGYNEVVVTDYFNLHEKLVNNHRRAIYVDYDKKCECNGEILQKDINKTDIIIFKCRHVFHKNCFRNEDSCTICKK